MSSGNEIEFESIQRIFAERDRRNAEALKKQRIQQTKQSQQVQQSKQGQQSLRRVSGEPRYERTPESDEFYSSKRKTSSSSGRRKIVSSSNGKRVASSPSRNSRSKTTSRSGGKYVSHKNGNPKAKAAGVVAALAMVTAALGGIFGGGGQAKPAELQPVQGTVISSSPNSADDFSDIDFIIDEAQATPDCDEVESATVLEMPEHVSERMVEALKGWESLELEAYYCPGGKLTIGYGHTAGVKEGMKITKQQAEDFLKEDLIEFENYVKTYCRQLDLVLCQADFDAMTSFAYNNGPGALWDSGILQMLADGDREGAIDELLLYVNSNGEYMQGLATRREKEAEWLKESLLG